MFHHWRDVEQEQVYYVLGQLKDLFSDQKKWIDWPIALDEHNTDVAPTDKSAVKWCLMGASIKFAKEQYGEPLCYFIDCATRNYIEDLSGENIIGKMIPYDKEYELITTAYELLAPKAVKEEAKNENL